MIKYAKIEGFFNAGEVGFMTHLYQWVEKNADEPMIILVRAYDTTMKIWQGYIYHVTETYINTKLDKEILESNFFEGVEVVEDLKEFLKGNEFYETFKDYKKGERK